MTAMRTGGYGGRQGADDIISMIHDIRWWQSRGVWAGWSSTGAGRGVEEEEDEEDAGPMEQWPQLTAVEPALVLVTY